MEIEDQRQQRLSQIEKYDYYTYHEFSLKPTLLSHYIILLKEEKEYEKIDQIFLCYLHQFNQFYQREETLYKQQQQQTGLNQNNDCQSIPNISNNNNTANNNMNNNNNNYIAPLKLAPLVESKKKLKKLLHFLVIISYQHSLNIRKYLENEKIRDFDSLFFDTLLLYAANKNDLIRQKQIICQKLVYEIHYDIDGHFNQEKLLSETNIQELILNLISILQTDKNVINSSHSFQFIQLNKYQQDLQIKKQVTIIFNQYNNIKRFQHRIISSRVYMEQFEKCYIYVKEIENMIKSEQIFIDQNEKNHNGSFFFRKDYFEGISKICNAIFSNDVDGGDGAKQSLQDLENEKMVNEDDKEDQNNNTNNNNKLGSQQLDIINNNIDRRDSFYEETDQLKNYRKESVSKMIGSDIDEEIDENIQNKQRSNSADQYDLIDQNFYTSFTGLSEIQQVKIADSLLQQNLNHQNNVDLENQKEFHILLCKEDSKDTNLSLNLITISIQIEGQQQNSIEIYTQQCEEIIKSQGIPIPSSIFAFFMTLSKSPRFEECIQSVIYSIETILKNYAQQNSLNMAAIYDNLALPEGYERNERREGISGLRDYEEIYSVYTLILLKSIFYLRWVILAKKNIKDQQSYDQPKNEDILKNVFMLWNILYQFNLKKKSQIAQFIQITNNYTCLQIIKAVIFSYWTRYLLEKVYHNQNNKKNNNNQNQYIPKYTFNLTQIGALLAQDDTYLQTEQDFFNYVATYSLKFEDFDEYIIINSLAPQFSVKNFEEESFEFLLSQIFKQEKKMLKQYNSEQSGTQNNNTNNKGVEMEETTIENKQLFLGKKEQNQYKSYKKYAIEKIRYYYLSGNYAKSLRLLINLMNQNFLQKYKNQEIFTKESINCMLATSLYHQKCYVECLICLQFSDKVNYQHIQKILEKITYFNYSYVPLLLNITLIKQLLLKFNKDSVLAKKLIERIESPECYQNYSDGKYHKIKTLLKIKFLKILKDKQFEIQQMKVVSSSVKSVSLSSYQSAKQL